MPDTSEDVVLRMSQTKYPYPKTECNKTILPQPMVWQHPPIGMKEVFCLVSAWAMVERSVSIRCGTKPSLAPGF